MNKRLFPWLAGVVLMTMAGGCQSKNAVEFTNVSDSWLNVRYYVAAPEAAPDTMVETESAANNFVSNEQMQIAPGSSADYVLTRNQNYDRKTYSRVHILVQPVSPSWEGEPKEYWLEMLTQPPTKVVATGTADRMTFITGDGAIAVIPDDKRAENTYDNVAKQSSSSSGSGATK